MQGYPYLQLPAPQSLYITFLSHLLTVAHDLFAVPLAHQAAP